MISNEKAKLIGLEEEVAIKRPDLSERDEFL
jgi:hypothetical protein